MRILIFGDSIAQGFFDSRGGWAQRLASNLHIKTANAMKHGEDFYVEVHNIGISGDTIDGLTNRLKSDMERRRLYKEPELIIIAIGTNDAILKDNKAVEDVYEFQEKVERLIDMTTDMTDKVLFVGIPPVDESQTDPWLFSSTGKQWKNNRLDLFEDTIKQAAELKDVEFVPVFNKFFETMEKGYELHADGLHPNDAGHELIYKLVKLKLDWMLI